MDLFKLAWRNLWRNRRRTLVTTGATTFALLMMIVYSGLVAGYLIGMEHTIVDLEVGDVQVHHEEYRKNPSLYSRIDKVDDAVAKLEGEGYLAAPRMLGSGLAAAGDNSAGVSLRAVDVERDAKVSSIHEQVMDGEWLDAAATDEVVLGKRLAKILGVSVGDEFVILSQGADGSTANDLYKVRGVLKAVSTPVDRGGIYMNAAAFRELMVVPEGAQQIIVRRPESRVEEDLTDAGLEVQRLLATRFDVVLKGIKSTAKPDAVLEAMAELAPDLDAARAKELLEETNTVPYTLVSFEDQAEALEAQQRLMKLDAKVVVEADVDVKTWKQLMPTLANMLESTQGALFLMFGIIYMAIGIVILNAMLMAVFERVREFGVLKALGVSPRGVLSLVFTETVFQILIAIAAGVLISLPVNWYLTEIGIDLSATVGDLEVAGLAFDPYWKASVDASTYSGPITVLVVIVSLAVIYPAFKAAFIRPVEAMRHQ
jgi:ABC-type lipoprotein release transport system permease subunit